MSDELVERLRSDWFGYDVSLKAIDAMEEAADRIEQLTAERDSLLAGHRTLNIDGARLETRIEKLIAEREMAANWWKEAVELTQQARLQYSEEKARAEKAEAEVLALREVIGAVNNEFGSAAWNWPDPWRRVAQLKELSNDRWKRAEAAEAERDGYRKALENIIADCEADYPPSHGAIKYAARAALKGEMP